MKTPILFLVVLITATACTVQPVTRSIGTQQLEARADSEAEAGNFNRAARLYRELADQSSGTLRSRYLIEGARMQIERTDLVTARSWLSDANTGSGLEQQQSILSLVARIELEEDRPDLALASLEMIRGPTPIPLLIDVAAVRGSALFRLGLYAEGVREFIERGIWLNDAAAILANQRLIWEELDTVTIQAAPQTSGDQIVDGWLALAPLRQTITDDSEFRLALLAWRSHYLEHPAAGVLLAELLSERRSAQAPPNQIAILLPLSSANREFAIAIRDGFFAAYYASANERVGAIRIYDTALLGATEAYLRAQLDGADFIIGPLLRSNVEQVISQSGFVPTLALNFSQSDAPFLRSFYQFALAPADEARAVARQARAAGAETAIALFASDTWGYELFNAFRNEFEELDGRVLDFGGYDTSTQDFAGPITALLNISRSEQRHRRLAANLGIPVKFEARRRQDVDMVFLGAHSARAGRLLAPQLRFYDAGDIPTYATTEIYDPGSATSNSDLNGVIFPDAPLLIAPNQISTQLRRQLQAYWPERAAQGIRYYGMGFDVYQLMMTLYRADDPSAWPVTGISGELNIDEQGRIHRSLPFAQFQNGRPVALPTLQPAGELQPFIGSR